MKRTVFRVVMVLAAVSMFASGSAFAALDGNWWADSHGMIDYGAGTIIFNSMPAVANPWLVAFGKNNIAVSDNSYQVTFYSNFDALFYANFRIYHPSDPWTVYGQTGKMPIAKGNNSFILALKGSDTAAQMIVELGFPENVGKSFKLSDVCIQLVSNPGINVNLAVDKMALKQSYRISYELVSMAPKNVRIMAEAGGVTIGTVSANVKTGCDGKGSYVWKVPPYFPYNIIKFRVVTLDNAAFGYSHPVVILGQSYILPVHPQKNECWKRGTQQTISWNFFGDGDIGPAVKLHLVNASCGNIVKVISLNAPIGLGAYGFYTWYVPSTVAAGNYRIRVTSVKTSKYWESNIFQIVP